VEDRIAMALFPGGLHEDFGTSPFAYIPYGGADFGEIAAVAQAAVMETTAPTTTLGPPRRAACGLKQRRRWPRGM